MPHPVPFIMPDEMWINPYGFESQYLDTDGDGVYNDSHSTRGTSDIYKGLRADLALMNANYAAADKWYNAHESRQAQYDELVGLGVNPLSATRAVMGDTSGSAAPSASTVGQSGVDSQLQQVIDAFSSGMNNINQSIQTDLAMERQNAEIDHLNSESALNYANAGEVSGLAASQNARNYSDVERNAKLNEQSDAQITLIGEQYNLTKEQTRQAAQIADAFPKMNEQELELKKSQTAEYWSNVAKNKEAVEKMQHEVKAIDATTELTKEQTSKVKEETTGQKAQNTHQQVVNDYEALIGCPLGTDDKQMIIGYVERGDYNAVSNLLQASFDLSNMPVEGTLKWMSRRIVGNDDASRGKGSNYRKSGRTTYNP